MRNFHSKLLQIFNFILELVTMLVKRILNTSGQYLKSIHRFWSFSITENGKGVIVKRDDGVDMKFPSVWLRDNCLCTECFHDHTKSRLINWRNCNIRVRAEQIEKNVVDNEKITIGWNDKHKSDFHIKWLQEHDFSSENRKKYIQQIYKPSTKLWSKELFQNKKKVFQFNDIIQTDEALLLWLRALAIEGFAIVKSCPNDTNVSRQLANRIGFVKRTTYGEEFDVKSKENARNYAYMMTALPLHTDMPYYEYKAGINILHCYVQSKTFGGANLITDGFHIANRMRHEYPKEYDILLKTPVDWFDLGNDSGLTFHNIWRSPVICLDVDGNYNRINHNITKRDSHFTVPFEQVTPWYDAYDKFLQLAYEEAVEFKISAGEVFVFNNLRILHGRTAYEDSIENKRHMIGSYVDWDIIYSKLRILERNKHESNM